MGSVEFYFDLNNLLYPLIGLGAVSLILFTEKFKQFDRVKFDKVNKHISYAFIGLLLMIAVQSIVPETVPEWESSTLLMTAAVALGAVTCYLNRDKFGDIEEENLREEVEEKRRETEFAGKYPQINRVWGVRWAARWMYREGWWYTGGLIAIVLIGFILRIWNLGKLGYSTDEGSTALYAYYIDQTGLPCSEGMCYLRGLPYLYFVSIFTKIFGVTEFWVRFPGIIIALATVILLYILVRKIGYDKNIALLGAFLIIFADWHFMLSRYARMYGMLLFFIVLSFLFFFNTFYENKKYYLAPLIISIILALLTHQFAMLLVFLLLIPFFSKEYFRYAQKKFILFAIILFIAIFLALTKLPGLTFADGYIGLYDIFPEKIALNKYWYLANLQPPNFIFVQYMFMYLPIFSIVFITVTLSKLIKLEYNLKNVLNYFVIFSFIFFAIYKIDYDLKYLWWILPIIYYVSAYGLAFIFRINKFSFGIIILILMISSASGITHILFKDYGTLQNAKPLIMPTNVENYYVDDKTPIDFLIKDYKEGDIIITDYWMQDVYLMFQLGKKSDYFVSRWDVGLWMNKYPYYKLYFDGENYKLSKDGPIYLSDQDAFVKLLSRNRSVWYISSADFEGRIYESISNKEVINWINNNKISPMYIGKDNNSKVYFFNETIYKEIVQKGSYKILKKKA